MARKRGGPSGTGRKQDKAIVCPLARAEELGIRQVIDQDGKLTGDLPEPDLDRETLIRLYEMMVLVRAIDERGWTLQRSGRVEFWIPHRGLEAVHNAATIAFTMEDWIFMGYRHPGTLLLRGAPLVQLFAQYFGRRDEPFKGRRLPTLMGDRRLNVVPMTTQVGSYIPHACGAAWAAKIKRHDTRFLAMFGDGSSSRGEFHSGMNFAGVFKPPIVFICENNGWAVSTPTDVQTASATFAEKGDAYGVRNLRVDGNDALAVYAVTREARELAPEIGASLIEAVTYRMGFHTSSDNPDLYRSKADVEAWEPWDPLVRLRKYLEHKGFWAEAEEEALWQRCKDEIQAAIEEAEAMPLPEPASMFDDTFAEPTWMLEEQRAALLDDLGGKA
ncbi:MAG: thiamine pyrophosphate-dependent enzyme [Alphaproteobacteria bacterium]|nr:thiamine pyrophosphate-dependent enzyme [Alphaproteobacteria bacterium]MDP6812141.1 thiamine pyrophosphate-dependent enzyme [Alphaproteobacteria bacterium]